MKKLLVSALVMAMVIGCATAAPIMVSGEEATAALMTSMAQPESPLNFSEDLTNTDSAEGSEDGEAIEETEEEPIEVPASYDENGGITLYGVGEQVMANNYTVLSLQESIDMIEEIDYEKLRTNMIDALNALADAEWILSSLTGTPYADSYRLQSVESQYDSINEQYKDLKSGKMQANNADTQAMLRNTQKQLVIAAETMFMAGKSLELSDKGLGRQLEALGRTKNELDVRYDYGQVAKLNLMQLDGGVAQLKSGRETLNMNYEVLMLQLKNFMGMDLSAELKLSEPEAVTEEQLQAMDLEADLETAKENSYDLYDAKKTLDDEEKDYKDALKKYGVDSTKQEWNQAKHTWQSAQYSYANTVSTFELNFRTLYAKVKDAAQILEAAKAALELEKANLEATKLKYDLGTISANEYLKEKDAVSEAEDKIVSSTYDLISAYMSYMHAVNDGIINK